jgi:mono/diheme cytochrome c family protein
MRLLALSLFLLPACDKSADDTAGADTAAADGPTWYQDVRPVVYEACATCHNGDGIGPGDFTSFGGAYEARSSIAAWVSGGLMPLPSADPECNPFVGHERMKLDDEERALLVEWAGGAALEGDEATAAPAELHTARLADTDVEMPMPFEHTLQPDPEGSEYFCMVPENPVNETRYITGIDVDLGNQQVVHHMCLFVDYRGDAGSGYGVSDPSEGFQCADPIIENDWLPLHCWAPGMEPVEFPEGMGLELRPNYQLVLQMHYFQDDPSTTETDFSSYRLRTTDSVEREVFMDIVGPEDFYIPAGESAYSDSEDYRNYFGGEVDILGGFPHMHKLGASYRAWVERAGGGEECLLAGEYDFDHQLTYMFEEPMTLGERDRFGFECTWDNSATNPDNPSSPPRDVTWGEGTTEEMCYLLFYVSPK